MNIEKIKEFWKNTGITAKFSVIFLGAFVPFLILVSVAVHDGVKYLASCENVLNSKGYNRTEVQAFLVATHWNVCDLAKSKGVQNQFKSFLDGDSFIRRKTMR